MHGVVQVERRRSVYTLVYKYTQLVLDALGQWHPKPVKLREQRSSLRTDCDACGSVDDRLQSVYIAAWQTGECGVAVVQF